MKGLGLFSGAKFSPRLNREMSAGDGSYEDRLKIFIVFGVSVCLRSLFVRPPLQPLL